MALLLNDTFNDDPANPTVGFFLSVFKFGDGGRCSYISNAQRADVVALLKEMIARFQGQPEIKSGMH